MRPVDLMRSSPLLWLAGVVLCTPLIALAGVLVLGATVAGGLMRGTRQALTSRVGATGLLPQPVLATVLELRPAVTDDLENVAIYSRAV